MARILVAPAPSTGHLFPHMAVATALRARGHDVVVYCEGSARPIVERAGCECAAMSADDYQARFASAETIEELTAAFAGLAAQTAPEALAITRRLRIDAIVSDTFHLGAALAAERSRLPWISLATTPLESHAAFGHSPLRSVPTDLARDRIGLASDDRDSYAQSLSPSLTLLPWPSAFDGGAFAALSTHVGPLVWDPPPEEDAAGLVPADHWPIVLVTTSTSAVEALRQDVAAYLTCAIEALADLPVRGVVTAGGFLDGARPAPPNVTVVAYAPHGLLMPRTRVLVTHAGWGSISRALVHGVPQVAVPFAIDQPLNAQLVDELGVGLYMPPELLSAEALSDAVQELLQAGSGQRARADAMAEAVRASEPTASAARCVERVIAEGR